LSVSGTPDKKGNASLHIHRRDQLEACTIDIEIDEGGN
jgi:hypothetical protein